MGLGCFIILFVSHVTETIYTFVNCVIHIRNLIKFSYLKIISVKLAIETNSPPSLDSIGFAPVLASRLCCKAPCRVCVCSKEAFQSLKEWDRSPNCWHIKADLTLLRAGVIKLWPAFPKYPWLVFVNNVSLKQNHDHLFLSCLWLLFCYNGRAE